MSEIESVLVENRRFKPSAAFAKQANLSAKEYRRLCALAEKKPDVYWAQRAAELRWMKPWKKVCQWKAPFARWFVGGKLNASDNCLDRHVETWRKNKAAIIWEGEPGDERVLTYQDLWRETCRFANVLKGLGVKKGDRVTLYMPLIPELAIAMLACARIGAAHSVIFGGFTSQAIADRVEDAESGVLITADGGWRRGGIVPLKANVDDALTKTDKVKKVVVFRRTAHEVPMKAGRDFWWHELMKTADPVCPPEPCDAEQMLYILYTSGTTGKPKGVVHTTGGYMTWAHTTSKWVFDLKETDTYWCTADIGWVTGHSYVVYGPLSNGATIVMYEGAPNHPQPDRFWQIVAKYGVTIFYTAPTAIRAFMKWGDAWPKKYDLSSLRLLGSVGEPINPEAWMWYHRTIGGSRCPIVDTWWQTETGGILISPLPGVTATKPGSATLPLPGIFPRVLDAAGRECRANEGGLLVIAKPWASMLRTVYRDDERFRTQYFSSYPGLYFTGDSARRDKDGYVWVMGRVDDVIKVAGHRLGTAEIESAIVSHPTVAEAAVVGKKDEMKGEAICAFVTLRGGEKKTDSLRRDIQDHVAKSIGSFARPEMVRFTDALPKTRSGKIMRRLLRKIASGDETLGDTTTLEDLSVLARLREDEE
ncbi:MAG: acetate--CoA ligase [Candidatus Brocadiae bacterium]|nr:acetate--CoA ligase [Candidatus Brocadiia bacterium]